MKQEVVILGGQTIDPEPQSMTSWSSSIKIWFLQAYSMHY